MYLIDTSVWIDFFKGELEDKLKNQILSYIENDEIYYFPFKYIIGCSFFYRFGV